MILSAKIYRNCGAKFLFVDNSFPSRDVRNDLIHQNDRLIIPCGNFASFFPRTINIWETETAFFFFFSSFKMFHFTICFLILRVFFRLWITRRFNFVSFNIDRIKLSAIIRGGIKFEKENRYDNGLLNKSLFLASGILNGEPFICFVKNTTKVTKKNTWNTVYMTSALSSA